MKKQKYDHAIRPTDIMKLERLIIIVSIASLIIGIPAGLALKQRAGKLQADIHIKTKLQSDVDRVQRELETKATEVDTKASDIQKLIDEKKDLETKLQSKAQSKPLVQVARAEKQVVSKPPVVVSGDIGALLNKHFGASAGAAQLIMYCESGGVPSRHNDNPTTGDDSWGLFQINRYGSLAKGRPSADWLVVAENNISYAAGMYKANGSWRPWTNCARKHGLL